MDKVLIEVYVPVLAQSYDIFIPKNTQFFEVLELIKKAVYELSEGRFVLSLNTVICFKDTGAIIDINKSANEQGINNGSQLMLI